MTTFYDSFHITTDGVEIELQVTAFSKTRQDLKIGDEVQLRPVLRDREEGWEERLDEAKKVALEATHYQVECSIQGIYIEVKDGKLVGVSNHWQDDLPQFDGQAWLKPKVAMDWLYERGREGETLWRATL